MSFERNFMVEFLDYIELMLVVNNYAAAIVKKGNGTQE